MSKMRIMKAKDHKIGPLPGPKGINKKMIVLLFKTILRHISLSMVKYIPWAQGMCDEALDMEPCSLAYVSDHFKTQGMRERAVEKFPRVLEFVPDHFKTHEMCNEAAEVDPHTLKHVPTHLRMHEMCKSALGKYLHPMRFIPDHLKAQEMCEKAVQKIHIYWVISLIILRHKKCVSRLLKMNQKP